MEPPAELPKVAKEAAKATGGTPARVGHVTVKPRNEEAEKPSSGCTCDPVRIDWSLLDTKDGQRFGVEVEGGTIIDSSDRPLTSTLRYAQKKWAAGVSVAFTMDGRRQYGAFVDRDAGRFRFGAEVSQREGGSVSLRAGIRF
jgi:hypothetical protein